MLVLPTLHATRPAPHPLAVAQEATNHASSSDVVTVDVVALDRDGRFVDTLGPGSFAVTVDGKPRRVLWVRHVSRGPGATDEAIRRAAQSTETFTFAAEPARDLVVVIDEGSIPRGSERAVVDAAGALVDRFGLDDRIGVVRLPIARDTSVSLTTERPAVRAALKQVVGKAVLQERAGLDANRTDVPAWPTSPPDPTRAGEEPERPTAAERERPPVELQPPETIDAGAAAPSDPIAQGLLGVVQAMRSSNRRVIVALFSAALPSDRAPQVDAVALAASEARAVIYTFGVQGASSDAARDASFAALERLATLTGGSFTLVGRNAARSLEKVTAEFSACYVLGIETAPSDAESKRHALRVEAPGRRLTLRAPAWLVATPEVGDWAPSPSMATHPVEAAAGQPGATNALPAGAPRDRADARGAATPARDSELQRLVSRAADYVARYQRESSLLVAEEEYHQSAQARRRILRSDLLLVRPADMDGWISFRDVFEVDGQAVRDRDDRLKRMFLEPSKDTQGQLSAIMAESARYNIGYVYRNINVPLFALELLHTLNLPRFRFKLGNKQNVDDVATVRVSFEEEARPTIVHEHGSKDLPVRGWFLVDPASGAIVRTWVQFTLTQPTAQMEYEVFYRRDDLLGLWVPREMRETYLVYSPNSRQWVTSVDARAKYSKFRRFQVTTEEQIKIPK